jgi:hypothetical protein
MRQKIKELWGKVKPIVLILVGITIGVAWTLNYQMYKEIRTEATQTWESHLQRIDDKEVSVKAHSPVGESKQVAVAAMPVNPNSLTGEIKTSPSGLGVEEILPKIYQLESSGGKNDSCKSQGKVNGYGFMISKFHYRCYETKEEVEKDVASWFTKNLKDKTLAQSLCYYQSGIVTEDCEYAQKFARL